MASLDQPTNQSKIIYLISTPRSSSVAFTMMMDTRGDCSIFHEPSQCAYDMVEYPGNSREWFKPDAYKTFEEVKQAITSQPKMVFVKEVSFAVERFITNDEDFIKNPRVHFVFLVKHPYDVTISYYKKMNGGPLEITNKLRNCIGHASLFNIYERVKELSPNASIVINTDNLQSGMEKMCKTLDIPHIPVCVIWNDHQNESLVERMKRWHEQKTYKLYAHWHGETLRSSGFRQFENAKNRDFEEISDEYIDVYRDAYEYNLSFYEKMMKYVHNP